MANLTVSVAHSLQLVPINRVARFAQTHSGVKLGLFRHPDPVEATPGSIKVSTSGEDGIYKKSIDYKVSTVDRSTANLLERYAAMRLVAIYTDETGSPRVAGSPDHPLTLTYTSGEGVFSCKLEGESDTIDPFLI